MWCSIVHEDVENYIKHVQLEDGVTVVLHIKEGIMVTLVWAVSGTLTGAGGIILGESALPEVLGDAGCYVELNGYDVRLAQLGGAVAVEASVRGVVHAAGLYLTQLNAY